MRAARVLPRSRAAWALVLATPPLAWLAMMAVHELGHVLGAWLSGGRVERVVLHPLAISRTDVSPNPRPLVVAWAGPVVGVALPLLAWGIASAARWRGAFLSRWIAGFCLIANGAYLAVGSFDAAGDAGTLLAHGAPSWTLWLFGVLTAPLGIWLWHGQARHFGVGPDAGSVPPHVAAPAVAALAALIALGMWLGAAR